MATKKSGFTLIELSIVLVIIGLIIGGVLVGRDLIRAAELRASIAQLDKFRSAALAFKLKYGHLPGDISPTTAASFGFFQITGSCTTCRYNNGLVDYADGGDAPPEFMTFWRHLSEANLVEGNFGRDATNPINATTGQPTDSSGDYLTFYKLFYPGIKAIPRNYWMTQYGYRWDESGLSIQTNRNVLATAGTLSPSMAHAFDSKMDDGKPNTGSTLDIWGPSAGKYAQNATDGNCTYGGAGNSQYASDVVYNIDASTGGNNTAACYLFIHAGF